MAGAYALITSNGLLIIFPILNILNGIALVFMFRMGCLNESNISDQHMSLRELILTATIVIILFFICNSLFKLMWLETLSISLIYATNLIRLVQSLIMPMLISKNRPL